MGSFGLTRQTSGKFRRSMCIMREKLSAKKIRDLRKIDESWRDVWAVDDSILLEDCGL